MRFPGKNARMTALACTLLALGAGIACTLPIAPTAIASDVEAAQWTSFRDSYLHADGRVVDVANHGVSHSEGQGYGMLLAETYGDREAFDRMRRWTRQFLARPDDHLSAWRYLPDQAWHVPDKNNATDGDLFIAWALLRAGERWGERRYTDEGVAIARDLLRLCVIDFHGLTLLAPGAKGFEQQDGYIVNPSYYAFPALRALALAVPNAAWSRLEMDGLRLLRHARFGPWQLPPDWLFVGLDHSIRPAAGWPARFSYDAIRVPLYLTWAGLRETAVVSSLAFWTIDHAARPPAWASLTSGEVAPYPAGAGVQAIRDLSLARLGASGAEPLPTVGDAHSYYDAALVLLARVAAAEAPRQTRPQLGGVRLISD